jgi:hypothetical protein
MQTSRLVMKLRHRLLPSQEDIPLEQSRGDIVVVASHDPPDFESDSQFEEQTMMRQSRTIAYLR